MKLSKAAETQRMSHRGFQSLCHIRARTVNELWDAIGHATDIFTPAECENYFAAAGYDRV